MTQLTVTTHKLNLRRRPHLSSQIIGVLHKNQKVKKIEFCNQFYWVKVQREDGLIGWASYKFLINNQNKEYSSYPEYLRIALGEQGIKEIEGDKDNFRIIQYLQSCDLSLKRINENADETPWCSAFVNWCMEKSGIEGTNSAWALHWLNWGKETTLSIGSIAVFKRFYQGKTFGHVGFFMGIDPKNKNKVLILGGNQSKVGEVNIRSYPFKNNKYELVSFRKPIGLK